MIKYRTGGCSLPVTALGFREARINGEKTMEEKFKEEKVRGRGTENIDEEENMFADDMPAGSGIACRVRRFG